MKALVVCLLALPAFAGEFAVLSSGFRIHADRHERAGDTVRLFNRQGVTELPAGDVIRFEKEEYTPLTAPAAQAATPPDSTPPNPVSPQELVRDAARRAVIPVELAHSVAKAESGLRPDAVSKKGAIGIMQLMPGTASALSADPRDPKQNADAGAMYLRELLERYDGDVAKALAAYNAGPGAVDKYKGVPPYPETRSYVNRVIRDYKRQVGASE
jgi:soluble lytic murein transglycosylase-like protein